MSRFKYFAEIANEELDQAAVIPCRNEQGLQVILIKNSTPQAVAKTFATDNLTIKMDKILSKGDRDYPFHVIESKRLDGCAAEQFSVIYDYIFGKIDSPISSNELYSLISSLEEYFRMTPDPNRKQIQIGVFGELITLQYFCGLGYLEILQKYHENFFTKHDIELSSALRLEVKSSAGEKRIHHFKHNQLYRKDARVLVSSVLLEFSEQGLTLYDLFMRILSLTEDPDKRFALRKLMIRCGVSEEDKGLSFSEQYAFTNLKIFDADALPKIQGETPKGISEIQYDVDCAFAEEFPIDELMSLLRSI